MQAFAGGVVHAHAAGAEHGRQSGNQAISSVERRQIEAVDDLLKLGKQGVIGLHRCSVTGFYLYPAGIVLLHGEAPVLDIFVRRRFVS